VNDKIKASDTNIPEMGKTVQRKLYSRRTRILGFYSYYIKNKKKKKKKKKKKASLRNED